MQSSIKPRAKLTQSEAIAIFSLRNASSSATAVGCAYSISEKAVRDVWKARTWAKETWHLDMTRALDFKRIGRPAGRKDSKPRKIKASLSQSSHASMAFSQSDRSIDARAVEGLCAAGNEQSLLPNLLRPKSVTESFVTSAADVMTLDDQLFEWGQFFDKSPHNCNEPFAEDWALALASLTGSSDE